MSDSIKDALTKAGVAPEDAPKPPVEKKKWANELPEDETPLARFDTPARTKAVVKPYVPAPATAGSEPLRPMPTSSPMTMTPPPKRKKRY